MARLAAGAAAEPAMEPRVSDPMAAMLEALAASSPVPRDTDRADRASIEHECMTAHEIASWLRLNRKTVYEYAARGVIPCRRIGRRLVFSRNAIAAWLATPSTSRWLSPKR